MNEPYVFPDTTLLQPARRQHVREDSQPCDVSLVRLYSHLRRREAAGGSSVFYRRRYIRLLDDPYYHRPKHSQELPGLVTVNPDRKRRCGR